MPRVGASIIASQMEPSCEFTIAHHYEDDPIRAAHLYPLRPFQRRDSNHARATRWMPQFPRDHNRDVWQIVLRLAVKIQLGLGNDP